MDHDFYKQRIEELPIGYTYNKMICDQMGAPCDFELIEVNEAFEKIIGLKKPHIIGKKITELFRGIADGESDWFHFYEEIALHRDKKEIKHYWKSKKRWYKIQAYSHEKLYVVAHFTDITLEMNQLSEMERLFEISDMLLQTNDQKIGYQQIAEDFLKISEAKYAAFNLFDEDGKSFKTMAITGDKGIVNKVSEMIGYRIDEKQWEYTEELDEKIKAKTITHFKGLRDMAGSAIPAAVAILLEKTLNIGEIVVIKISKQNVILGDFTLFMEKGKSFSKHMLAEVYTRQLGMLMSRKRAEERLAQEKTLTDAVFYSAPGMIYLYDEEGRLVRWNKQHEELTGYSAEELSQMKLLNWYEGDEKSQKAVMDGLSRAMETGFGDAEANLQKKDGSIIPMYFTARTFFMEGRQYFTGVAIDITERRKREEEIANLSYRDQLTGLYNRRFYEEELLRLDHKRNLPLTIVMGDVNGLKLVNDSFGHVVGDQLLKKVAQVMTNGCRSDDIIARLAGDEFIILLPKTDELEAAQLIERIVQLASNEKVGSIDISISFGSKTKNNPDQDIEEIFKNAEDIMYKNKLLEGPNMRGKTINAIIKSLYDKYEKEEGHSLRVSELCISIGEALRMSLEEVEELKTAGLLHDIGKVAIDENIINKRGKLTTLEIEEIRRHSEIGYRMLNSVGEMTEIAKFVLYHHERWDGEGYPKGLRGEDIPLVSRIIRLADAFDDLIYHARYPDIVPMDTALGELQKYSGNVLDPNLVTLFLENQ